MPATLLVVVVLIILLVPAWESWRAKRQLLLRLRVDWGRPRKDRRDMEAVADFFRSTKSRSNCVDDRTWNDLLMDDVFSHLDRTESSVGQQMLYYRLRSALTLTNLPAFEALVTVAEREPARRVRAQVALTRLRTTAAYYVHRLARRDSIELPRWHAVFPVWTGVAVFAMSLVLFFPKLFVVGLFCFITNFVIRHATARRAMGQIAWFRTLAPLFSVAAELVEFGSDEPTAITGSLKRDLASLKRLRSKVGWFSRDPVAMDPITFTLLELLNVLFLLDTNALYFASAELQSRGPELLKIIEAVGEIDAAIAVASFRAGTEAWVRPQFVREGLATFKDIYHPLIEQAVTNSISLSPPYGVLITGSNMSGKSTFLRTVGLNVLLAQTIDTCLASFYESPVYRLKTCIGRADDLVAGKSYYLVEVESVLALVNASREPSPHLFIFDELFRGTNAVERVAAAEAVLHELVSGGKPHVVLAATHDGELVDLLTNTFAVFHLGDSLGESGLVFDYHLKPGPATTRNAIALLQLNGAPESLVARAVDLAATLDRRRQA
jgi:hypothetical protein